MDTLRKLIVYGSALYLFVSALYWFLTWWGLLGVVVATFMFPVDFAFPFIYLFVNGFDLYILSVLLAWIIAIVGGLVLNAEHEEEAAKQKRVCPFAVLNLSPD